MHERILVAVLSGLVGSGLGWAAQALTLNGRVAAIEAGQARIETALQVLLSKERP